MTTPSGHDRERFAARFADVLSRESFDFFTGVPCSLLGRLWSRLEALPPDRYVSAVREDSALGLAAGAWLGGRMPCVLMQNSGLGVAMNALASLHQIYELPVLLVVSWRGEGGTKGVPEGSTSPAGFVDAPEHWVMGDITPGYFALLGIEMQVVAPDVLEEQVAMARARLEQTRRPVALVVRKGLLDSEH